MSCTEWNYQKDFSDDDVLGAVISVDALAVYAREGVDLATKWTDPKPGSVMEYALLQLLTDFDQKGGSIAGSTYVNVSTSSDMLGAHGFVADEGQVRLLLIGRQVEAALDTVVELPIGTGTAQVYRLDAQHQQPGTPETNTITDGKLHITMPALSAALVVVSTASPAPNPPAPSPSPIPPAACPGGNIDACMALCPSTPAAAYTACAGECGVRCQ